MINDIATSTSGLISRMNINSKNELKNYDEWIKEILIKNAYIPKECLDVGCGVGKQTILLHELYPGANISSVDKAKDSLNTLWEHLKSTRVNLICADIDDIQTYCFKKYDVIISSYAFYYSKNMTKLLVKYNQYLKEKGVILLLGYSRKSNSELIHVINRTNKEKISFYMDFMSSEEIVFLKKHFSVDVLYFDNKVCFDNISNFQAWFETSELFYQSESPNQVILDIQNIIQKNGNFLLTKETFGVVLKKRSF